MLRGCEGEVELEVEEETEMGVTGCATALAKLAEGGRGEDFGLVAEGACILSRRLGSRRVGMSLRERSPVFLSCDEVVSTWWDELECDCDCPADGLCEVEGLFPILRKCRVQC